MVSSGVIGGTRLHGPSKFSVPSSEVPRMARAPLNWFLGRLMSARRLFTLCSLGDREVLRVFCQAEWTTDAVPALVGFSLMLVLHVLMAMIVVGGDELTLVADRVLGLLLVVINEAKNNTHTKVPARRIPVG